MVPAMNIYVLVFHSGSFNSIVGSFNLTSVGFPVHLWYNNYVLFLISNFAMF